jgi:hypothetical protein
MFQIKFVDKIKTCILHSIKPFFFSENRTVYDIMCKKCGTAGQATDENIIWCMCFACYVTKATDTNSEYVIYLHIPTAKMDSRKRLNITVIRTSTLPSCS